MKRRCRLRRKTGLRKQSKTKVSVAKRRAWNALSQFIVKRDSLPDNHMLAQCYTCDKLHPTEGRCRIQAGHLFGGRRGHNLWNEQTIKAQCYACNILLGGNHAVFEQRYINEYGQAALDEARRIALTTSETPSVDALLQMESDWIRRRQIEIDKRTGNRV